MSEVRNCECCGKLREIVGIACIPGIPMSIGWCRGCLNANVAPYWAAVANTACCGGWEHTNKEWQQLVERSLKYFEISMETFLKDVQKDIEAMDDFNSEA